MNRLSQKRESVLLLFAAALMSVAPSHSVAAEKSMPATITVHARQFAFVPEEITVHAGQPVRLFFISDDVPHAISVDGLSIDLPITKKPTSVVITPEKIAELTGKCSRYCGSGHHDMRLTIHVIE